MASLKHDFLANMSHEIRTPINSILGICYLMQQRFLDDINFNYVQRLQRSGENLLGIINDVLDISKIESGKMELINEPFELETLIDDVHKALEIKANEKGIDFIVHKGYPLSLQINGDYIRLLQVLSNLISNAIKFTSVGNVTLECTYSKNKLRFTITDTGIGISKDNLDKIFERYEQATATIKTTFGGTGLGLSISKKIIELMDGTIEIKSKLNKGTTFIVTIPVIVEETLSKKEDSKHLDTSLLNNKHILIADDNLENRLVAKDLLQQFNNSIIVYEAENGNEVLNILSKNKIDILFIDLDMPILNGIETVQEIKKNKIYEQLKIIGNTASLSTLNKEEFLALGFHDFIFKPYQPIDLLTSICK